MQLNRNFKMYFSRSSGQISKQQHVCSELWMGSPETSGLHAASPTSQAKVQLRHLFFLCFGFHRCKRKVRTLASSLHSFRQSRPGCPAGLAEELRPANSQLLQSQAKTAPAFFVQHQAPHASANLTLRGEKKKKKKKARF